ncbi:alpha/beta hydrolase family protein [Alkalicoccus daliensis]|uniref:Alpha/beta hydrolase family protein n=1 Tax=Alkalicoccus daliensis TaxID=745820 RepID=A0A1G9ZIR7_9BACI|nr:hypothetical protein [Alkalicoccus daliensis]SDN21229.1 Alpha/beta hydrolase family protein [Alkalicoccus daliensis]
MNYQDSYRQAPASFRHRSRIHSRKYGIAGWWITRFRQTGAWDRGLEGVLAAIYIASIFAAVIGALGTPTGLGTWIDIIIFVSANTGLFILAVFLLSFLMSLLYIPLPRLIFSASAYTAYLAYYIQEEASLGTFFITVTTGIFILSAYVLGSFFQIWLGRMNILKKILLSLLPAAWFVFLILFHPTIEQHESESAFADAENSPSLSLPDPGEEGELEVIHLHYGNGEDRHREQFNENVDLISTNVDASLYIEENEWPGWRTRFWGFDQTSLPLNGEMWLPDGQGPFPLVLIAHGNHRMENFSDGGYGYLGEHLASHGYAAVSIDQNFVNFSNWTGIPDEDMKLRAWLFMQHLLELQRFSETEGNLLEGKLNMDSLALIGHSRGGQAVAMVADHERFFENDPSLAGIEELEVTSIVGIAPTDQEVDDTRPAPGNVNYLTLHGARDGDVHNFRGDRQYSRTSFTNEGDFVKSAVYIADANHSQFNTDWGRADMRLPGSLFLSREQMMEPEEQRELTKVFISAFFEVTLRENEEYLPLFKDVRTGREWLPETQYVTRYLDTSYEPLVTFNSSNPRDTFPEGVEASGENFTEWEKVSTEDRKGGNKAADGVIFEWDQEGSYTLSLPEEYRDNYFGEDFNTFSFSMAQMDKELENYQGVTDPELHIRFVFDDGNEVSAALDDYDRLPDSVWTQYSRYPFLEEHFRDGKYDEAIQPAFHTHMIPVEAFTEENVLGDLEEIIFEFSEGPGRLIIDDIGFFSE